MPASSRSSKFSGAWAEYNEPHGVSKDSPGVRMKFPSVSSGCYIKRSVFSLRHFGTFHVPLFSRYLSQLWFCVQCRWRSTSGSFVSFGIPVAQVMSLFSTPQHARFCQRAESACCILGTNAKRRSHHGPFKGLISYRCGGYYSHLLGH